MSIHDEALKTNPLVSFTRRSDLSDCGPETGTWLREGGHLPAESHAALNETVILGSMTHAQGPLAKGSLKKVLAMSSSEVLDSRSMRL
jgi:hypothetical protein